MNIQKKVEVYLDKKRNTRQIDVVQGDTGIQLVFMLMDFIAPDGTTATLYVQKPSGKFVYQEDNITVSSDTVTVDLENQAITEYGKVYYQLALVNGADEITTFASIMMVEKKYADSGAEESKTVISSFKQLTAEQIAQIKAATQTQIAELQTESARQQELIEGKGNTTLASIPEDYTATYNMAVEALRTKAPVIVQKATGSPILVKDGARMPFQNFATYGRSTQNGTPTSDNPIDIKSVGDSGYFDGELLQGNYSPSSNGAYVVNALYVCTKNPIPCKEGDIVKVSYETTTSIISITYFDKDMNYINYVNTANVSEVSVTIPANTSYVHISINENGLVLTPTNAKHICVTINGKYALIQKSVNKNLWKFGDLNFTGSTVVNQSLKAGTYTFSTLITSSGTDSNLSYVYILNEDSANGTYGAIFALERNARASATFTLKNDVSRFSIFAETNVTTSTGDTATFADIQIELGTVATDYVPHEEQTTYIPISQPLRGIGEVKDEVVKVDGVWGVLRRIAERIFDDTLNWLVNGSYANTYYIGANIGLKAHAENALSTHYRYVPTNEVSYSSNSYCMFVGNYINFKNADISSLDDWKVWVAENPITVQYELAEETFTPFADQTPFYEMKTFDGVTLVSASDDAEMEIEYATDTKIYIDNKIAEISAALLSN